MNRSEDLSSAHKPPRRWVIATIPFLILVVMATGIFLFIGRWLVVEDPLQHSDAIVVLSGRMPQRAVEAARLYKQGYAPQVWLTRPREPAGLLEEMHIAYIGEDFYNAQVLMHEGVPSNAVRLLEPSIHNTADEIQAIAAEMRMLQQGTVIIVTSKAHTRRVHLLWRELSQGSGRAVVRAAGTDTFTPGRWWRDTGDALDVVRETLGLLNAWAGLPLKPAP
jgi:uncharacterized SAM-binding protein YcdF (DUF218 family)